MPFRRAGPQKLAETRQRVLWVAGIFHGAPAVFRAVIPSATRTPIEGGMRVLAAVLLACIVALPTAASAQKPTIDELLKPYDAKTRSDVPLGCVTVS